MLEKSNSSNHTSGKLMLFDLVEQPKAVAKIRVVGVGGAGGNAINRMIEDRLTGVDFIAMNTDVQALEQNKASCRIQIGKNLTRGLGAGGVPEVGRRAIEENKDAVIEALSDSEMVFIACGMGGGTGTGAAPIVAEIARELVALTVGIVTKPFQFEGKKRTDKADSGICSLKKHVDTLIVVPNQKLISLVPKQTPLDQAFRIADDILMQATKGISDVINTPGLVNLDFADVENVMRQSGDALMGSGIASGENRGHEAAEMAINSPLIDNVTIAGAEGVLINITGGSDLTLHDINMANTVIHDNVGDNANIIFGAVIDESLENEIRVTLIATGFQGRNGSAHKMRRENGNFRSASSCSIQDSSVPILHKLQMEPLEKTFGEVFGHDGSMPFVNEDDPNIPAYMRKLKY